MDRIKEGLRDTTLFSFAWSILSIIVIHYYTGILVKLVIGIDNTAIISTSERYLRFHSYFFPILAMVCLFRNTMQGFGDSVTPIISSLLELAVKLLIAFILCRIIAYNGVILCEPVAWCIMVVPLIVNMLKSPLYANKKTTNI